MTTAITSVLPAILRSRRQGGSSKLGRCAKHCKGRRAGAFRTCVRSCVKGR